MGIEIERKFLVGPDCPLEGRGAVIRQGYLLRSQARTVRVRTKACKGYLTVKGPSSGAARTEFEYVIPFEDANALLDTLCEKPLIEKVRHEIEFEGSTWEVDVFSGDNEGLILAEVELKSEDEEVPLPEWIGEEVTGVERYFNAYLVGHPYSQWARSTT